MNDRKTRALIAVLLAQAVCELASIYKTPVAVGVIGAAVLLGVAYLVRSGRLAGPVLAAVAGLFLVTQYPTWTRHNALDWTGDSVAGALALAMLVLSVLLLVARARAARQVPAGQVGVPG